MSLQLSPILYVEHSKPMPYVSFIFSYIFGRYFSSMSGQEQLSWMFNESMSTPPAASSSPPTRSSPSPPSDPAQLQQQQQQQQHPRDPFFIPFQSLAELWSTEANNQVRAERPTN